VKTLYFVAVSELLGRAVGIGWEGAIDPPHFGRSVDPIKNGGGRIMPTTSLPPSWIFRPSYDPARCWREASNWPKWSWYVLWTTQCISFQVEIFLKSKVVCISRFSSVGVKNVIQSRKWEIKQKSQYKWKLLTFLRR
jgi:hypothetical protein